jgi:branched-chain amino acid transport system permease protein
MSLFFTQLMIGIQNGAIYASLALALVLIFKTTGILNFAQGEMALYSTYLTWYFTQHGLPVWFCILLSVVVSFIGGALIERIVIRPVEKASPLVLVIVTIGMFLAINSIVQVQFGSDQKILPAAYPQNVWRPGGVQISTDLIVLVGALIVECAILYFLLQRTKLGLAVRAVASNSESSRMVGIPVGRMLMFGWGAAAALGAIAGSLVVPAAQGGGGVLVPSSMQSILVFAFAAAALGGFDSIVGAVVGGMIVGVAQSLTIQYVKSLSDIVLVVPFGIILLVLLFRPAGLFGKPQVERV